MLIHLWQTPTTLMRVRFADVYVLVAGRECLGEQTLYVLVAYAI